MIPRVLIDSAPIPGGGGELRLIRRGEDFWIMLGANALMSTRLRGSEEALAPSPASGWRGGRGRSF